MELKINELYTPEEVKDILKLKSIDSIYRLIRRGQIQAIKLGKYWRIRGSDIERFIELYRR